MEIGDLSPKVPHVPRDVDVSDVACKLTNWCLLFLQRMHLMQGIKRYILLLVKVEEVSPVLIERIKMFTRYILKGLMGLFCL